MTQRMSEHFSRRRRRWTGSGTARLLLAALASVLNASACLGDVTIPPCVQDDTCSAGAGGAGSAGTSAGDGHGAAASQAGSGGDNPSEETSGGTGGPGAAAGEGGEGGAAPEDCSSCRIQPLDLAPPCAGSPYSTTLSVEGGVAPYSWQLTPSSDGWSITVDPEHPSYAILTSTAAASGVTTLTVRVMDANRKQQAVTYALHSREACWFAYTALSPTGPLLHLLDPLVEPPTPATLENNSGVYDFQFSPNGAYLAYRFGADVDHPRGQHVSLVDLGTLQERVLSFAEDFVTGFAWSPDSSTLAASFKVGATTYLGAVRVPPPRSDDSPISLTPTLAYVESDLSWVGNRFVAYHAELLPDFENPGQFEPENPTKLRTAFYAELVESGFSAQVITSGTSGPGVVQQPTEQGFYMVTKEPFTRFTPLFGDSHVPASHLFVNLIAPSGSYSAQVDADKLLKVLTAEGGYLNPPAATARAGETCPRLLAWAKGVERIACVADVPNTGDTTTHGEVRIFDLEPGNDLLTMSTVNGFCLDDVAQFNVGSCGQLQTGYAFGTQHAIGAARAFSPSGRWLAFSRAVRDDHYLYWADLEASPMVLSGSRYLAGSSGPSRLRFSPDERFLLFQQGSELLLQELTTSTRQYLDVTLPVGQLCTEDFPMAPDLYCGNTERTAGLQWASDSLAVAYRTAGALTVVDITQFPGYLPFPLSAPECGQACSNQFSFQPPVEQ